MKLSFKALWLLGYCSAALCNYTLLEPEDVQPIKHSDDLPCPYDKYVDHPRSLGCDTDHYNVTLKPDHTVQEHFDLIGKDLSPHLIRRYDHGYIADLKNQTDVELIQRDTGLLRFEGAILVEVMPQNLSVPTPMLYIFDSDLDRELILEPWDEFHPNWPAWPNEEIRRQLAPSTPTRLPEGEMQPIRPLTDREMNSPWAYPQENEFEIGLQPGHTLDGHFAIIGREIPSERVSRRQREDPEYRQTAGYTVMLLEGEEGMRDLDAIRSDSGVAYVGQVVYWNAICGLNGDMPHLPKEEARRLCAEGELPT